MPTRAPKTARQAHSTRMMLRRTVETATLSTKFGFFVRGLKMELGRCVLRLFFLPPLREETGAGMREVWPLAGSCVPAPAGMRSCVNSSPCSSAASSGEGESGAFFFGLRRSSPMCLDMVFLLLRRGNGENGARQPHPSRGCLLVYHRFAEFASQKQKCPCL